MGGTYRDIFKWGDPGHVEALEPEQIRFLKKAFKVREADLKTPHLPGDKPVKLTKKCALPAAVLTALRKIVGADNVETDDFARAYHAYGKFYRDLVMLRLGRVPTPPDAVVYPRDEAEIAAILALCESKRISLTPFGGHSSVTRGVETPLGGISLDLTKHLNHVVRVSETNATATVQAGMFGPAFEEYLNTFGSRWSCGNFPQSFEYSTVGGWVSTRAAGQASTGYGKMEDMVLALRVVTPRGTIATNEYPAAALGPNLNEIFLGAEGTFGVVTEVTMKIRAYRPEDTAVTSFVFPGFEKAVGAMREVMQAGIGTPHLFRISDHEETEIGFQMIDKDGSLEDRALRLAGFKPMKRCLMFVTIEGERDHGRFVARKIAAIAWKHGGVYIGRKPTDKWLHQRYSSAYLRDPLMDAGIMSDTLETGATWEKLLPVWEAVRAYIKSRPDTICMAHISHVYENGANLYFTFLSPMKKGEEVADFEKYHRGIVETIHAAGGALSHHHGIGKMLAPWLRDEVGAAGHDLLQAIKDHLDPHGILNPGGTLGFKSPAKKRTATKKR